jgi:hypothetical protein
LAGGSRTISLEASGPQLAEEGVEYQLSGNETEGCKLPAASCSLKKSCSRIFRAVIELL